MSLVDNIYKLRVALSEIGRRMKNHTTKSAEIDSKLPHVLDVLVANIGLFFGAIFGTMFGAYVAAAKVCRRESQL